MSYHEVNSLLLPRAGWAKLSRELRSVAALLQRLRSPNPDQRRLALISLTGHEAEMVLSLADTAAMTSVAPDEVSPLVLS